MTDPIDERLAEQVQAAAKSQSKAARAEPAQGQASAAETGAEQVAYERGGHGGNGGHDGNGGHGGHRHDGWHGHGDDEDDGREIDPDAEARLVNLDEALHGAPEQVRAPALFWDGTTDQAGVALGSIEGDLELPEDRPDSDLPPRNVGKAQSGS
jgi:hypothetical protein